MKISESRCIENNQRCWNYSIEVFSLLITPLKVI